MSMGLVSFGDDVLGFVMGECRERGSKYMVERLYSGHEMADWEIDTCRLWDCLADLIMDELQIRKGGARITAEKVEA